MVLNAESTAVGLVMNGIAHYYLMHTGRPAEVKAAIRLNAQAFIDRFEQMLEDDPYALHPDNLPSVYDAVYTDAVSACLDALETMPAAAGNSGMNAGILADEPGTGVGGLLVVDPSEAQEQFSILAEIDDSGKMSGDVFIENDTRLLAHYQVTDALTGEVLKDLPDTFFTTAFNQDIISAQEGFWGGFIASDKLVTTEFRNVVIDVYTPGILGIDYTDYFSGPSPALLARSTYSSYLLPVIGTILPISDLGQAIFGVMADNKAFDDAIPHWYAGDLDKGLEQILSNLKDPLIPNPLLSKIIETAFEKLLTAKTVINLGSKLGLKLVASEVMAGITKVELEVYENDLKATHAHLTFNVAFPVTLENMQPKAIAKDQDEETTVSLYGTGLQTFTFDDTQYAPQVFLTARDKHGEYFDSRTLSDDQIATNVEGTVIEFVLPAACCGLPSPITPNWLWAKPLCTWKRPTAPKATSCPWP